MPSQCDRDAVNPHWATMHSQNHPSRQNRKAGLGTPELLTLFLFNPQLRIFFFIAISERVEEREVERGIDVRETHRLVASTLAPTGARDQTYNPGT